MITLALHHPRERNSAIELPSPRSGPVSIRPAVLEGADMMFIDALQKQHSKMVGFMHWPTLEANIKDGHVLVAEDPATTERIGYIISHDKYLKREELGIVYHLNIVPGHQRGYVGGALVKAAFDRAAYGCTLFCCWCAQDLAANYFWESIGFVPIAFRAGSRGKAQGGSRKEQRIHIFWQRRIREGDAETPYWFPSQTHGGAMMEPRIVLPIPPGTHWSDAKPAVLPGMGEQKIEVRGQKSDVGAGGVLTTDICPVTSGSSSGSQKKSRERKPKSSPAPASRPKRGLWFVSSQTPAPAADEVKAVKPAKTKGPKQRFKNDPKYVKAARDLRDRYLEEVNANRLLPAAYGKYDVSRQLAAHSAAASNQHPAAQQSLSTLTQTPLLNAA